MCRSRKKTEKKYKKEIPAHTDLVFRTKNQGSVNVMDRVIDVPFSSRRDQPVTGDPFFQLRRIDRIVKDEQFGPAVPILRFSDDAEAIALANDSNYGLCSSVWSSDRERAVAVARQLEAGYTYLNAHGPAAQDSRGPFGGFKHSGFGRNLGYEGVLEFQEYHTISSVPGWLFDG